VLPARLAALLLLGPSLQRAVGPAAAYDAVLQRRLGWLPPEPD
jgi:hypothetical protein